uniref:Uncharacterized protein n=1 Tax=Ditylenchus dipsaci TaxID=166011 RepID=A0A915EH88_9BILA
MVQRNGIRQYIQANGGKVDKIVVRHYAVSVRHHPQLNRYQNPSYEFLQDTRIVVTTTSRASSKKAFSS